MNDCACEERTHSFALIDRRSYAWGFLQGGAGATIVVVDHVDLLPYSRVELWLRVHAASIAHTGGASFAVELQAVNRDPESPDVVFYGGLAAKLVLRNPAAGLLIQRKLPPAVLARARLRVLMQQASTKEPNTVTISAGALGVRAFGSEAA